MSNSPISPRSAELLQQLRDSKARDDQELIGLRAENERLRAENERLRKALNRGVSLMPVWFSHGWIAEAQAALAQEEKQNG